MSFLTDVYQDCEQQDKLRDRILIYKNLVDAKPGTVYPVAICLQGLLRQFHVEMFRNWSGHESEVACAVQHVSIASKEHLEAWQATICALNLADIFAKACIHQEGETT
ncbi:hypothetical protein EDB19DRAFT_1833196 [Suillus lakei]|nr:hypothetical protein EDB19DRAFT_1833196 [Suillus lakei]